MTFGDTVVFLFVMVLASVLVAAVIFAGALAVSFVSDARPIREEPAGGGALPETRNRRRN